MGRVQVVLKYFNPRSPCGERRADSHSSRPSFHFNPRSPCGERQVISMKWRNGKFISIHAPRVGSDMVYSCWGIQADYFNPRSPCGERHLGGRRMQINVHISIHAPRVGSDKRLIIHLGNHSISIHAPRVGSDLVLNLLFCRM